MIPLHLKKYFWEVDTQKLDVKKYPEYVIARILEYGRPEAVKWMLKTFDTELIKKTLRERRGFSRKTAYFWSSILDISKNQIACLNKSYQIQQKGHWYS